MIASPYRTSVTQKHAFGDEKGKLHNLADVQPDMRRYKGPGNGGCTSEAPRTREGKAYPGGKGLRRAFARLHARHNGESGPGKLPDRLSRGAQKQGNYYLPAETLPGSMKA